VVVITERFHAVAMATLRSQRFPESIVIEIKGNPEFIDDAELAKISATMADDIAKRLAARH
jgi:hypothetical protein